MGACLSFTATAWSADVYLRAEKFTKTLPAGSVPASVEMWGFALRNADGTTYGPATSPGPVITVPDTDPVLNIHLINTLPEPVSIVIPGQQATLGDVQTLPNGRIRSFTKEAAPGGPEVVYVWPNVQPGTYLYHSGSHPALQVQMGLYGAVKKDAATGQAYAGVPYSAEVTLLLSEIDVDVHEAVRNNQYGPGLTISSMIDSIPEYFLVNGEPYTAAQTPIPAGQAGQTTLLRLVNACGDDRVPVLNNYLVKVIAEDGQKYTYPKDLSAVLLPALKTRDALLVPDQAGTVMFYDRRLGLANHTAPDGGMYQQLTVGP